MITSIYETSVHVYDGFFTQRAHLLDCDFIPSHVALLIIDFYVILTLRWLIKSYFSFLVPRLSWLMYTFVHSFLTTVRKLVQAFSFLLDLPMSDSFKSRSLDITSKSNAESYSSELWKQSPRIWTWPWLGSLFSYTRDPLGFVQKHHQNKVSSRDISKSKLPPVPLSLFPYFFHTNCNRNSTIYFVFPKYSG